MSNSDDKNLLDTPQDSNAILAEKLDIIIILLREGFNIPDENSSLKNQPKPILIS